MIEAVFTRDAGAPGTGAQGALRAFAVRGHAGLAPKNEDVLCAAVSALAQGVLIGLEEVVQVPVEVEQREGWLRCRLAGDAGPERRRQAQVLLQTLLLSLRSIEEQYRGVLQVREVLQEGGT